MLEVADEEAESVDWFSAGTTLFSAAVYVDTDGAVSATEDVVTGWNIDLLVVTSGSGEVTGSSCLGESLIFQKFGSGRMNRLSTVSPPMVSKSGGTLLVQSRRTLPSGGQTH